MGQSLTWNFPPILQRKPLSLDDKINHSKLISHWRHIPVDKLSAKNPSSQAAEFQFWKVSWFRRVCGVRARIASERSGQVSPLFAVGPQPGSSALPFHFPLKCYLPAMPALPACPPVSGPPTLPTLPQPPPIPSVAQIKTKHASAASSDPNVGEYSNLCKTLDWGIRALRENHLNHTTGRHCSMCNCGLRNTETTLVSNIQLCSVSSLPKAACFASERDLAPYVINLEENRATAQWPGWKVLPSSSCQPSVKLLVPSTEHCSLSWD